MNLKSVIHTSREKLADFCKKNHIKSLSLFGSVLNDTFHGDSDIDLLVQFKEGEKPGFFELVEMERTLSELFGGRKIDLRTPEDLSRYFRDEVLKNAEVLDIEV